MGWVYIQPVENSVEVVEMPETESFRNLSGRYCRKRSKKQGDSPGTRLQIMSDIKKALPRQRLFCIQGIRVFSGSTLSCAPEVAKYWASIPAATEASELPLEPCSATMHRATWGLS